MKIRYDRLKRVADYLARKKESPNFSMFGWEWPGLAAANHCGFAGCAMGWVAHRKMFRGFSLDYGYGLGAGRVPVYQGEVNYAAVAKLFGITERDVTSLFGPSEKTPKQVANAIRNFVTARKAEARHA